MRRIALLATVVAAVFLALSSFGAWDARAGWTGGPGNTGEPVGGWPTIQDACTSWQGFTGPYQYWSIWFADGLLCHGTPPSISQG
jgi:hypothetical protein